MAQKKLASRTRSHWTKFDVENKAVLNLSQLVSSCLWANQKSRDILNVAWSSEDTNKAKSFFPHVKIAIKSAQQCPHLTQGIIHHIQPIPTFSVISKHKQVIADHMIETTFDSICLQKVKNLMSKTATEFHFKVLFF